MKSFFSQMSFFLSDRSALPKRKGKAPGKRRGHRYRDADLEELARGFVGSIAPELSEKISVGWNSRMRTTAGVAIAVRCEIWLNPALKTISEKEVTQTLLHELAHLVAQHRHGRRRLSPHGVEWRQACRDLGIPDEKRTHQLPFEGRRMRRGYLLRCPACGESHDRVRPPRRQVACLACCRRHHGGRYHESFRLEILKNPLNGSGS